MFAPKAISPGWAPRKSAVWARASARICPEAIDVSKGPPRLALASR